ncbi:MAG TPA: DedA family protein [Myxococcota bacterium]|nr:DedA family protein [Myxococcota bacterium]
MHLDWEALLTHYGYLAVLVGTFLEGESILVMGGLAAHEGYLELPWVLAAAFAGSFSGDQLYFFIGRLHGKKFLAKRPAWQGRVDRVHQLLERYHTLYILGFRFLYGLRTISPFVLGTGGVRTRRFFILNFIGALVWSIAIGGAGYLFGGVVTMVLGKAKEYFIYLLAAIFVVGGVLTLRAHLRQQRRAKEEGSRTGAEALASDEAPQ